MVKSLKSRNNGMACHCFLFSALGHPFLEIEQICSFFLLEGFALLYNNLLHNRIYSVCPTTCGIIMFILAPHPLSLYHLKATPIAYPPASPPRLSACAGWHGYVCPPHHPTGWGLMNVVTGFLQQAVKGFKLLLYRPQHRSYFAAALLEDGGAEAHANCSG